MNLESKKKEKKYQIFECANCGVEVKQHENKIIRTCGCPEDTAILAYIAANVRGRGRVQ